METTVLQFDTAALLVGITAGVAVGLFVGLKLWAWRLK